MAVVRGRGAMRGRGGSQGVRTVRGRVLQGGANTLGARRSRKGRKAPANMNVGNFDSVQKITSSGRATKQIGHSPFGESMLVRLPWVWNTGFSQPTAGLIARLGSYRLNSIHDIDIALGGKACQYYDQLTKVYKQYRVYNTTIELNFSNPFYDGLMVGYRIRCFDDTAIDVVSLNLADAQKLKWCKFLPINNTGAQSATFKISLDVKDLYGYSKARFWERDDMASQMGANPVGGGILEILACSINTASNNVNVNIKMLQRTLLTSPYVDTISA